MCVCVISRVCHLSPCLRILALLYLLYFTMSRVRMSVVVDQKKKCKCLFSNTAHEDVEARPFTHEYTVNRPVNLHRHLFFLSCTQMLISYTYLLRSACVRRRVCVRAQVCVCVCVCVCVRVCVRGTNHPISSLDRLEGGMHEGFVKIEDKSHLVLHLN